MTNVKLKLMFFLLNSLLAADIVQARPYPKTNSTDTVLDFSNTNSTFSIPVNPDSDTLVVATDDERLENANKEAAEDMETLVNAEQDRDEVISQMKEKGSDTLVVATDDERVENANKEAAEDMETLVNAEQDRDEVISEMKEKGLPENDSDAVEKRMNISSPSLHEMINSETDREDSLTDLMFRPESEFAEDMPRFEFLIAAKINESDVNRTAHAKTGDKSSGDVLRKVDYVELVEVMKPMGFENKSAYLTNITGHEVDNDVAPDTSEYIPNYDIIRIVKSS